MKKKFEYKESRGLPGGPNEMFTYVTGVFSMEGYKRNSPDVNNPFNIIPSGNITMKGVDFPVIGTDNLGNTKVMQPGGEYEFPGDMVFETPLAKYGGSLPKAQGGNGEYTVKSGDTFYGIANKNDVPWEALKEANPDLDYENLKLDQSIVIPKRINRSPGTPKTKITGNTGTGLTDDLFIKQAYAESSFNPTRKSGAGAKGLTQFTDRKSVV